MKQTITKLACIYLLFNLAGYAKTITASKKVISPEQDDVKFIIDSSLSTARWKPGLSSVDKRDQKLLDYKTEGLKLYSVKGTINIFDSDVLTIEKYGTFANTVSQRQLIKLYKEDKSHDTAIKGLNISVKVFLLLKYFYFKEYKYLDALEYQYSSYKFSGLASNSTPVLFWYGPTTNGIENKDFFKLSTKSTITFFTDFKEHKIYLLELSDFLKRFPVDSFKIGFYNINWLKPLFLGSYSQNDIPIIHYTELTSSGIVFDLSHKFYTSLTTGVNLHYGFDNYINYTSNSLSVDYYSYNFYINYDQKIYSHHKYDLFAYTKLFLSKKYFNNDNYNLNNEEVSGVSLGLKLMF